MGPLCRKKRVQNSICKPFLSATPIFLQQTESLALVKEVNKLLHKGAVEKIEPEGQGFYSRIFLVPKKNGKLRLIIDLSRLNTFLDIQLFRTETAIKVRQTIQPNDWAFSLDLTGVVGWCEGVMYLMSLGRPADIGLQLGKACYPCSG